jgi:CRP/FNR family cyclic AMP-dependent transcriptional regulator
MEPPEVSELFPLFSTASKQTLAWFLEIANELEAAEGEVIIKEGDWGKSVFAIVSGWVKLQHRSEEETVALDIFSEGDCFGEMAILDESPRSFEIIALSEVRLLTISAQRFLQLLLKDPQLQQRLLQLSFRRINRFYRRSQLHRQAAKKRLVDLLLFLADNYGKSTDKGTEIFLLSSQDIADITAISLTETEQILETFDQKDWLDIHPENQALYLVNLKQLSHFVRQA